MSAMGLEYGQLTAYAISFIKIMTAKFLQTKSIDCFDQFFKGFAVFLEAKKLILLLGGIFI